MAKGLWPILNVDNVEKSAEYYSALGIRAKVEPMDMPGTTGVLMGTIELGDSGIILWSKHNLPPDAPEDTRAWTSGELGKGVLLTVGVPNARKTWEKAQKARAEIEMPLEAQPWGGWGFTLIDPDGYVVNVTDRFPDMSAKPKAAAKPKTGTKPKAKTGRASAKPKRKGR